MEQNVKDTQSFTEKYKPLLVIIAAVTFSAAALAWVDKTMVGFVPQFMQNFMGLFFVNFAMFKLIDLNGFADGFSVYDIIAKRSRLYAILYPFIELGIGLLYLSAFSPILTNIITLLLMLVSGFGVIKAVITSTQELKCACLGTTLNVPLSTVSIIENFGMATMAGIMLWQIYN